MNSLIIFHTQCVAKGTHVRLFCYAVLWNSESLITLRDQFEDPSNATYLYSIRRLYSLYKKAYCVYFLTHVVYIGTYAMYLQIDQIIHQLLPILTVYTIHRPNRGRRLTDLDSFLNQFLCSRAPLRVDTNTFFRNRRRLRCLRWSQTYNYWCLSEAFVNILL